MRTFAAEAAPGERSSMMTELQCAVKYHPYNGYPKPGARGLMIIGVGIGAVGGCMMLSDSNPKSSVNSSGQGLLFLGVLFFAVGGVVNLIARAAPTY